MRTWARLLVAAATCALTSTVVAEQPQDSTAESPQPAVTVGIFPFLPAARLEAFAGGITSQLSRKLQQPVEFRTRKNYEAYHEAVISGRFDLAMVHPLNVPTAMAAGLRPVARYSQNISVIFLIREDRELRSLSDLVGGTIALPAHGSMVEALARQHLAQRGIAGKLTVSHAATHDACIHAMLTRKADSCATTDLPLAIARQRGTLPLRILERTPSLPSVAYLARPQMPEAEFERLQAAVLRWEPTPGMVPLLKAAGMAEAWAPTDGSEYLNLTAQAGAVQ